MANEPFPASRTRRPGVLASLISLTVLALTLGALAACAVDVSRAAPTQSVRIVGFAGAKVAHVAAQAAWQDASAHHDVDWLSSYGASGEQSRALTHGLPADVVHLSTEPDMTRLVDAGIIAPAWTEQAGAGIVSQSVVVLVVRPGNPKGIRDWRDLTAPGVRVVTPNPGSSGAARWNILAAYGAIRAQDPAPGAGEQYLTDLFGNIAALPGSGRDATTSFLSGTGDVLISQEHEAIFARANGAALEYIVPQATLLVENPGALTSTATPQAKAFFDFVTSAAGQREFARAGFRPLPASPGVDARGAAPIDVVVPGANNPDAPFPQPLHLLTMDADFGGWAQATADFFGADGLVTGIQNRGRTS